jgi:hypothetical protein
MVKGPTEMTSGQTGFPSNEELLTDPYRMTFWVENKSYQPMQLIMEPWGTEFAVPQRGHLRVEVKGPKIGGPVIWRHNNDLVYDAWSGSTFAVYKDGELISWSLEECPPEPGTIQLNDSAIEILKFFRAS